MIEVEDAQKKVIDEIPSVAETQVVNLENAIGRVVAEEVLAPFPDPPFSNSAMDGYALCVPDTESASEKSPVVLKIGPFQFAGSDPHTIRPHMAYPIGTGAPIPEGADAVIPKEDVEIQSEKVIIRRPAAQGENIRMKGENVPQGTPIFVKGDRIKEKNVGLLASFGIERLSVFRKPRVSYFATGDEIVNVGEERKNHQIYNSNGVSLRSLFIKEGCDFLDLGICRDSITELESFFEKVLCGENPDILVITGGVSVGQRDYIREVLEKKGAQILFHGVNMKPGKPLLFAKLKNIFVFGLPGNPLSTITGFYQFIYPAIQKLLNCQEFFLPKQKAFLLKEIKEGNRHQFLMGVQKEVQGKPCVLTFREGSHNVASFSLGDCFISVPAGAGKYGRGDEVTIQVYA